MSKGNGHIPLPPLPAGTAIMIPDGKIEITYLKMPDGSITFSMTGRQRNDVTDMHPVQCKAIVMQALSAFANAEFQEALRAQQEALKAAQTVGLVEA